MTTTVQKTSRAKKRDNYGDRAKKYALKAGPTKIFLLSTAFSVAIALLFQYVIGSPQAASNEVLSQQLTQQRRQNALGRTVQQTKPEFLQEFRRVINNYSTARELLPSEAEISNVLDSIQQTAKASGVKVTMFDASKPGAKSSNLAPQTTSSTPDANQQQQQPQITLNERVIPAQIQGNHAAVVRFLNAISRYPRIIYIREFSITSLNREETVNLTLVTYDAPTSGILPPIPSELRDEFQSQGANARLSK